MYYRIKIKSQKLIEDKYQEVTGYSAFVESRSLYNNTTSKKHYSKLQLLFTEDFNIIFPGHIKVKNKVKHYPVTLPILKDLKSGRYLISDMYLEFSDRYNRYKNDCKLNRKKMKLDKSNA